MGIKVAARNGSAASDRVLNCGEEPLVVLSTVKGGDGNYGYNGSEAPRRRDDMGITDQPKLPVLRFWCGFCVAGLITTGAW